MPGALEGQAGNGQMVDMEAQGGKNDTPYFEPIQLPSHLQQL